MIIKMQKQLFDSLSCDKIGHICFEPMVPVYQNKARQLKREDIQEFKSSFIYTLTKGQRALFMFFSFYDHAIQSEFEFYRMSNYYIKAQTFSAVKKGIEYFSDEQMPQLLTELENLILTGDKACMTDDLDYLRSINKLYILFQEIAPDTIRLVGECIKSNPLEFIQFE